AAGVEDGADVCRIEVVVQLHLVVQDGTDPTLAVDTVAAGTVGLEDVVAVLDRPDDLRFRLDRQPARAGNTGNAQLVEVVEDHEHDHDQHSQEPDPATAPGLA